MALLDRIIIDFGVIIGIMLTIKNLTKIYKQGEVETIALNDVSFKVEKGKMIALMEKADRVNLRYYVN